MAAPLDFDDVYLEHAPSIFRFCLSQLRDVAAAEDAVADVFLSAFKVFDPLHPPTDMHAWLFRIARNNLINRHRARARFARAVARVAFQAARQTSDVDETVEVREELREAMARLHQLRQRDQVLVGLRCAGGLSFAEIGRIMNISEDAAAMATRRAVAKLRQDGHP